MKQILRACYFKRYTPEEAFNTYGAEELAGDHWVECPIAIIDDEQIAEAVKTKLNVEIRETEEDFETEFDIKPLSFWKTDELVNVYLHINQLNSDLAWGTDKPNALLAYLSRCNKIIDAIKAISKDTPDSGQRTELHEGINIQHTSIEVVKAEHPEAEPYLPVDCQNKWNGTILSCEQLAFLKKFFGVGFTPLDVKFFYDKKGMDYDKGNWPILLRHVEDELAKIQPNESQKYLSPSDYLENVSGQINKFIVGNPANKNQFCTHIRKVIQKAEEYGQYLRAEWQKAKQAGLTEVDKNKDKEKWFWWSAYIDDYLQWSGNVYFPGNDCMKARFYIEGKPKPDPLRYLSSMIWGCAGKDYEGLELLDYQFVLLAIIHDAQNWQAGRERIYFNPLEQETLSNRLCKAVCSHSAEHQNSEYPNTIETALLAVKADLQKQNKFDGTNSADAVGAGGGGENISPEGEWSKPMGKSKMMSSLGMPSYKKFNAFAKQYGIKKAGNRQTFQIRLDGMDKATRNKLERA